MSEFARVEIGGPLFERGVERALRRELGRVVSGVAAQGKREVQAQLTKGHGKDSGEYRRGIRRKLAKDKLSARVFPRDGRKGAWLEGTSKLNARARFKGLTPPPFAEGARRLQGSRAIAAAGARIAKALGG